MTSIDECIVRITKYITGQTQNICRLCFREPANVDFLDQLCNIETNYFAGVVAFQDIFKELQASMDPALPYRICEECADLSIKAFLFKQLSQYSYNKWIEHVERLERCTEQNMNNFNYNITTAFFLMKKDRDIILTSRRLQKNKTKAAVIRQFNYLLKEKRKKQESQKKLAYHKKIKNYMCPHCPKLFVTQTSLNLHKERIHKPKTLQCADCSKWFSSKQMLKYHKILIHMPGKCKYCNIKFENKKDLREHMLQHEQNTCPMCNKQLKSKSILRYHMIICGKPRRKELAFYCDICKKGYNRKNSLRSHLIMEHNFGQTYPCKWCTKKYDAISKLRDHEVKHTRERKFSCEVCGGLFVSKAALIYHTRIHTGERPYPCDLCDERFLSTSRRMEHKRRKHFNPTLQCSMCENKFRTNYALKQHEARHSDPRSRLYVADNDSQKKRLKANVVKKIVNFLHD